MSLPLRGETNEAWPRRKACHRESEVEWVDDRNAAALLNVLCIAYDAAARQCRRAKQQLLGRSRHYAIVNWWQELPGVGPIRAAMMFAYLDTPWRFKRKKRLWKYCGLGLVQNSRGKDSRGRYKTGQLRLAWHANKRLKNAVIGAAISIINGKDDIFRDNGENRPGSYVGIHQNRGRERTALKASLFLLQNGRFMA